MRGVAADRRRRPGDDLISELLAVEADGGRLSEDELVATVVLLLNAGHEATVHTIGNGVRALVGAGWTGGDAERAVEEVLRWDPPLHLFTRHVYEPLELFGTRFVTGDRIVCLLGSAGRDPALCDRAETFDPTRAPAAHLAFGAGLHFCVGAPLARLELAVALPVLFERRPGLRLTREARYADLYHFRGHEALWVG